MNFESLSKEVESWPIDDRLRLLDDISEGIRAQEELSELSGE